MPAGPAGLLPPGPLRPDPSGAVFNCVPVRSAPPAACKRAATAVSVWTGVGEVGRTALDPPPTSSAQSGSSVTAGMKAEVAGEGREEAGGAALPGEAMRGDSEDPAVTRRAPHSSAPEPDSSSFQSTPVMGGGCLSCVAGFVVACTCRIRASASCPILQLPHAPPVPQPDVRSPHRRGPSFSLRPGVCSAAPHHTLLLSRATRRDNSTGPASTPGTFTLPLIV